MKVKTETSSNKVHRVGHEVFGMTETAIEMPRAKG